MQSKLKQSVFRLLEIILKRKESNKIDLIYIYKINLVSEELNWSKLMIVFL